MGVDLSQTVVSRKKAQAKEEKGKRPGMEEWDGGGTVKAEWGRMVSRPKAAITPTEKGLQVPGWIQGSKGQGNSYMEEKPASFTDLGNLLPLLWDFSIVLPAVQPKKLRHGEIRDGVTSVSGGLAPYPHTNSVLSTSEKQCWMHLSPGCHF